MTWSPTHAAALADVFRVLNEHNLPWLVLRNYKGLPDHNHSKDIDIGIPKPSLRFAEKLIINVLARHGFDYRETTVFEWGRCTCYFAILPSGPISIKIDLMNGFSWRGAELFNATRYLQNAQTCDSFLVPHPCDDAVIMWLKPLLTGGFVKSAYTVNLKHGIREFPAQFQSSIYRLFDPTLAEEAWRHVQSGEFEALTPFHKRYAWNAWRREAISRPFTVFVNLMTHFIRECRRRSKRPKATYLSVKGPLGGATERFISAFQKQVALVQVKDIKMVEVKQATGHPHSFASTARRWLNVHNAVTRGGTIILQSPPMDSNGNSEKTSLKLASWPFSIVQLSILKPDCTIELFKERPDIDLRNDKRVVLSVQADADENARIAISKIIASSYQKYEGDHAN